jgi:hypothetical protein
MGVQFDTDKLTPQSVIFSTFTFAALASPGYVFFYLYHRDFFITCDWLKLLLLSIGVASPFFITNIVTYALLCHYRDKKKFEDLIYTGEVYIIGAWNSILIFYFSLGSAYFHSAFSHIHYVPAGFLFVLTFVQLFLSLLSFGRTYRIYRNNRPSTKEKTQN